MNQARSRLSRQHVFGVGPPVGLLDDLTPLFNQASVKSHRASNGALALEQIRYTLPDLLFVEHPLPDMPTGEFLNAARGLVTGHLTVVVLAPSEGSEELSHLEDSGEIILRSDGTSEHLLESASVFLRKDRRCQRAIMVRLGVSLGNSKLLRLAQTANLSQRGMLVRTSEHFPLGSEVRFEILLPDESKPIRGSALAVRYADREKEKLTGVGVRFVKLDADGDERLRAFLGPAPEPDPG